MAHRKRPAKKPKQAKKRRRQARREPPTNKDSFREFWDWFLPAGLFAQLACHGNTKWLPTHLVILAFCWTWSDSRCLTDAFVGAGETARSLFGLPVIRSYQGFMRALVRWSPTLMRLLTALVRQRMEEIGGRWWRIDGWVPIAFDGSRSTAPRPRSNEAAYCAPKHGKGKTAKYRKTTTTGMRRQQNAKNKPQPPAPQMWMTLMWHMGLRLPWAWRLGPSNASERDDVMAMVSSEKFPEKVLFCGDAGFIGYPLWSAMMTRGHDFLVRAGANGYLQVEAETGRVVKEGRDQIVVCWPQDAQRSGLPPLRLRLIHTRINKTEVWLLTSVLERTQLTLAQSVRMYKLRWGIELEFRGLKQTLNRAELRCRTAKRARVELDWSILGMAVAELFALREQLSARASRTSRDVPAKRSLAGTMRAVRWCMGNRNEAVELGASLSDRLREAVIEGYERPSSKRARYRPQNPDKKPLGNPKLRVLTAEEKQKLRKIQAEEAG